MKTLVCFGDSNTFGYDPRSYIGGRYPPEERWVDLLSEALGLKCVNRGMNGRCIPRRGEGLSLAEGEGLIVMLGGNDLLCGSTAGECAELLRAFLLNCTPGSGALIIAPPPFKRGAWVPEDALVAESRRLAPAYAALARELGLGFADAGLWGVELGFDGVHFTPEGHKSFAKGMYGAVKALLLGKESE